MFDLKTILILILLIIIAYLVYNLYSHNSNNIEKSKDHIYDKIEVEF